MSNALKIKLNKVLYWLSWILPLPALLLVILAIHFQFPVLILWILLGVIGIVLAASNIAAYELQLPWEVEWPKPETE